MTVRVFALIVGIDNYQSGSIWNLNTCVDDAQRVKRFLMHNFHVSRDHIRLLLNNQATKRSFEDAFIHHLLKNPSIRKGDAIVIYFAGHGSALAAPRKWSIAPKQVNVLCPYDHDMKVDGRRIAGISSRSIHAMLRALSSSKGDNITFLADCCFSSNDAMMRGHVRWTPTLKATSQDLHLGLWPGAVEQPFFPEMGFYDDGESGYTVLAASDHAGVAIEGKNGGRFTDCLLECMTEMPLHCTSYMSLHNALRFRLSREGQFPACCGHNKYRTVFNGVPFVADPGYHAVVSGDSTFLRLNIGLQHGAEKGTELSLHSHNFSTSLNPPIATVVVCDTHPTWSLVRLKHVSPSFHMIPEVTWAKISKCKPCSTARKLKEWLQSLISDCVTTRNIGGEMDGFCEEKTSPSDSKIANIVVEDATVEVRVIGS